MTHDYFGTAGPPATPASPQRALRDRKWPAVAWFSLGAACVIAVVVLVGWYQMGAENRHLIDSCQQSVIDTYSGFANTEGMEFHGMTVVDYGDARAVLGVVTGGPPPGEPNPGVPDGVNAQAFECVVTDDGEARWAGSAYIL